MVQNYGEKRKRADDLPRLRELTAREDRGTRSLESMDDEEEKEALSSIGRAALEPQAVLQPLQHYPLLPLFDKQFHAVLITTFPLEFSAWSFSRDCTCTRNSNTSKSHPGGQGRPQQGGGWDHENKKRDDTHERFWVEMLGEKRREIK
jgi:hypothetical protein